MNYETILFNVTDGVAKLVLNFPDKLNSFTAEMHKEIRTCLKIIESDDTIRCLLITGNGRGSCAGQDLIDRDVSADAESPDFGISLEKNYNPLLRRLKALDKPVICAVNGVAEQAEEWGMIWKCIDEVELLPKVEKLATSLANQPTKGLGYIKRTINASSTNTFDQQLDLERDLQRLTGRTQDYREGVNTFISKRKPKFVGL